MSTLRVFASVGTDHHPFHRLVGWCDRWAEDHPEDEMTVQYGTVPEPAHATGHRELAPDDLSRLIAEADVVVCHGGPATITEARTAGKLPIVIPRRAALGEHVDDHQVRFVSRIARDGMVMVAASSAELAALLERARVDPDSFLIAATHDPTEHTVRVFGDLLDALCS